ncbi:hypothetical protein AB6A40_000164 [Gnathostoma spinigerum]|uniref:Uncharacterized protein n=1 Tax=Gnathostoma spinigerum TaxID=75299 RepID=A0ABD6EAX5_9BILA
MRYGKVYFYDRMGNRVTERSDKLEEAEFAKLDQPKHRLTPLSESSAGLRRSIQFGVIPDRPIPTEINDDASIPSYINGKEAGTLESPQALDDVVDSDLIMGHLLPQSPYVAAGNDTNGTPLHNPKSPPEKTVCFLLLPR